MTTNVVVTAHCGARREVVVTAADGVENESKFAEIARLKDGETYTAYATDTRAIHVLEVLAGEKVEFDEYTVSRG